MNFYLVSCAFVLCFFLIAVASRNRDLMVRSGTLFVLTQLTTLALVGGPVWFGTWTGLLLVLGAHEIFRHFKYPVPYRIGVFALGFGFFFLAVSESWAHYVVLPLYILVTICSFGTPDSWVLNLMFAAGLVTCVVGYGAGFLVHLDMPTISPVLSFFIVLQCNDAFGYLVGRLWGRTKLFPVLSPRKSVEGYIGGALGIAIGMVLLVLVIHAIPRGEWYALIGLGLVAWILGNVGDLLFSAVKRRLHIKDFSNILPGHGGILDRFDNIFFGAPLFYLAWHLLIG